MKVIGITGGIASGSSLVSAMFRDLGAVIIEADKVSREAVQPGTAVYKKIIETFGKEVLLPDGSLDRRRLGAIIFKDPAARRRLNVMTHPEIRRRIQSQVEQAAVAQPEAVVIVDVPLLLDTTGPEAFDLDGVIVVVATPEQQIERLMARDNLTREEAEQRLTAQRPVAEKAAEADWVIDNTGTVDETRRQVGVLWSELATAR